MMIQESYTSLHREQTNKSFWNSLNWLCLYFVLMAIRWNARYLHEACCMSNLNLELFGFHCSKQLSNSPRYKSGFGCTDGEVLERLWSYLRRFSRMTKEMRLAHRIDVLTDALLYYGRQAASNLSESCGYL